MNPFFQPLFPRQRGKGANPQNNFFFKKKVKSKKTFDKFILVLMNLTFSKYLL